MAELRKSVSKQAKKNLQNFCTDRDIRNQSVGLDWILKSLDSPAVVQAVDNYAFENGGY